MIFDNIFVSAFKNAFSTVPIPVGLNVFLHSKKYADQVLAIRAETDKGKRDELKKRIPAATICGTFRQRSIEGIETYNGLLCLDFDHADNPDYTANAIKAILADYPEVAYAALSVSGAGVFAIVPTNNTDPAQHPKIVDFMRAVFLQIGLVIDRSCKDVSRLRFVSYDPAAYINPVPTVFDAVRFLAEQRNAERRPAKPSKAATPGDHARYQVEQYLTAIEAGCNDVTAIYDDWLAIGFALASEFGLDGEDYYQRASQFHPKYDHAATAKKYAELCRNGSNRVRLGSFFHICKKNGIRP